MREVTIGEYLNFVKNNRVIAIEDQSIELRPIEIDRLTPSRDELTDISTTVWSFPIRGGWATHKGDYRGNWAPQIPRALILKYTAPGELVLDQMVGSGTTCVEARLLGRNSIGVDINYGAVILSMHRLHHLERFIEKINQLPSTLLSYSNLTRDDVRAAVENVARSKSTIYHGDARNLDKIEDESIDLIATHPPYFNIIKYGQGNEEGGDLSKAKSLDQYVQWLSQIAKESFRVLKPGRYCGILVGDTRVHKHYVPITHHALDVFLKAGFILKEEIIKIQHKMKTTREVWSKINALDFHLIYHEKLFIFRKPNIDEKINRFKYSTCLD